MSSKNVLKLMKDKQSSWILDLPIQKENDT